jgi:hypothetical protein
MKSTAITIFRTYYPDAVNGELFIGEEFQCYAIELPWLNNQPSRSCIPEGKYVLKKKMELETQMAFAGNECTQQEFDINSSC